VYVYPRFRVAIPAVSATCTATVPGKPTGVTHVTSVLETTFTLVARFPPKVTVAGDVRLVPVIVTNCPPLEGPLFGDTLVIVGVGEGELNAAAIAAQTPGVSTAVYAGVYV
jgi:hypothetical protein